MTGLKYLNNIYKQKGEDFIHKLLTMHVVVQEKLAGSAFSFQKNGNDFLFYKRNLNKPITKIERLVMHYYEFPISYIENLSEEIKSQIPENYRFCFEYFPNLSPNSISYDKLPQNKLVLTHIIESSNRYEKNVISYGDFLMDWSKKLNVSPPPIFFEGKLTEEQIDSLMEYIKLPSQEAKEKFKTNNFMSFVLSILNPNIKDRLLSENIDANFDSIVFTFQNKKEKYLAKLVNPLINLITSENNSKPQKNDIISLIFSDMLEYMELNRKRFLMYKLKSDLFEDRFIELMSYMFNGFYNKYGDRYADIYFDIPEFMRKEEFSLNIDFIENKNTLEIVNQSPINKEIFKLFLILFRKKKKNPNEFLGVNLIKYQNKMVDLIADKIVENDINMPTYENLVYMIEEYDEIDSLIDFDDLNEYYTEEEESTVDIELDDDILEQEDLFLNGDLSIISFWQKAFTVNSNTYDKPNKDVNIYVDDFSIFTMSHFLNIKELFEKSNTKWILIHINKYKKECFSTELIQTLLDVVVQINMDIFLEYKYINKSSLYEIFEDLHKKYYFKKILCPIELVDQFNVELLFIRDHTNFYTLPSLGVFSSEDNFINTRKINNQLVIETLLNNDYSMFKKIMPECIWNYFEKMRQEVTKFSTNKDI